MFVTTIAFTAKRVRRTYTPEFKEQMVKLYENGKSKNDIITEYDLTSTAHLFNSEIIGYSAVPNKDAPLVYRAFSKIKTLLDNITLSYR